MTAKTIRLLAAIVVALVLILLVVNRDDGKNNVPPGRSLMSDFKSTANDVTEIRITASDENQSITMQRVDNEWVIDERDGYAADVGKIRQLIIALAEAVIVEEKTSDPEKYDRLGVADPQSGGSGLEIVITAPDVTYSVILGNEAQGDFRYARIADDATSYLIDRNPDIPKVAGDWLRSEIIDIEASRILKVSISHATGDNIVLEKSDQEQTDFNVLEIPAGRELSYSTVGNGIAAALGGLELEDVRASMQATPTTTTIFLTWDGLRITADVVADDEAAWVSISAEAVAAVETPDAATSGDPSDAPEDDDQPMTASADEINARLSGWQYRLPDYKKNLLIREWEDILKKADED